MSQRSAVVLGTASQVPTRTRNHHALFLFWDEYGVLFDPGEGTQRQMLLVGVSAAQITHVCVTHFHGDHSLGLAGVVQRLSLDRVPHAVEIIYPASGQAYFERLRHATIYHEAATLIPRPVEATPDADVEVCRVGKARLLTRALEHGVPCQGYRIQEDDGRRMLPDKLAAAGVRGPAVGDLQRAGCLGVGGRTVRLEDVSEPRPGQAFAFVMDTRPCPGAAALARGVDLLVCEATYLDAERQEAHDHYHMTAAGAATLARDAGARRLVLTHFSQRYLDTEAFRAEAAAIHADVIAAADLTVVNVPQRR
jgi:ribonuclease Z